MANAVSVWGVARAFGGRVLLRIEDHDRTRSRPEFEQAILEDLAWLGFVPDQVVPPQREREARYEAALCFLETKGLVYSCACSRKSLEMTPGSLAGERRYPGTCRELSVRRDLHQARRVRLEPRALGFEDLRLGLLEQTPAEQCGDVLVRDRLGQWTYQFAVVVDDFDQGVDLVIRGEDLLASTGRQLQLAQLLGRAQPPRFLHHPLITRDDGAKLSKSNRDTGIRDLRAAGWRADQVLGRAAQALGLGDGEPIDQVGLIARLRAFPISTEDAR